MSARDYLETNGVEHKLAQAVAQVIEERPADAIRRISQLLTSVVSYVDTIGNTPLVEVKRVVPPEAQQARILCKLEMQNPGGSVKDRIAQNMIEKAEAAGLISPGKNTIVELTSGNTGIGVAMVAAAKGYNCIIIMPQVPPMKERYMICRQFGAEVHLCNPAIGFKGWEAYHKELVANNPTYWSPMQFDNTDNPDVHFDNTGPEIWNATGGQVDYFIAGIGTGGTLQGVGSYLKSKNQSVKILGLEPSEARVHTGAPMGKHGIVGIAAGIHSRFLENGATDEPRGVVDEWLHVPTGEAVEYATKATKEEGMMLGPSAGAALKCAVDVASRPGMAGKTIVCILPSHGIRYTAHPIWASVVGELATALPSPPPPPDKEAPALAFKSS